MGSVLGDGILGGTVVEKRVNLVLKYVVLVEEGGFDEALRNLMS